MLMAAPDTAEPPFLEVATLLMATWSVNTYELPGTLPTTEPMESCTPATALSPFAFAVFYSALLVKETVESVTLAN